jgi:molecular chaperone DnaK (HSP70)
MSEHNIRLRNDPFALEKLKVAAEGAKKALSIEDEVEIRIPDVISGPEGQPLSIERSLSIDEYAKLVHDLIQRTFGVCDAALSQAGVVARDLDGVILVGGPTRLPLVRDAVSEYFQQTPKTDVDPDEVVAMGAAIHAASLMNPTRDDAFLLDVTPLSLRIGVAGGLAECVIERNTPVPIEQTRRFTTFKDYQESVDIRVYQGESRDVRENELLGQFMFSGFEKARRGEVSIDITFEINADGIVEVKAKDLSTGKQASTRITLSAGLSDGDIDNIIQSGRTDRVAPPTTQPIQGGQPAGVIEELTQDEGALEQAPGLDEKLARNEGMPEHAPNSDEKLVVNEGISNEAILDPETLAAEAQDAATETVANEVQELVEAAEPIAEPTKPEPALRPIEMDDLITDEIEIPPALMDDELLPESDELLPESDELLPEADDLLELEGLEDVKLTPAAIEQPSAGKITAIDEDLTATAPTMDEPESTETENDLFEQPGTDLSELSDDETKG